MTYLSNSINIHPKNHTLSIALYAGLDHEENIIDMIIVNAFFNTNVSEFISNKKHHQGIDIQS